MKTRLVRKFAWRPRYLEKFIWFKYYWSLEQYLKYSNVWIEINASINKNNLL